MTDCPLFGKVCNPSNPVGPCMVSFEGGCSDDGIGDNADASDDGILDSEDDDPLVPNE